MIKTTVINAVEMVRRIRDSHHEQLQDKSPEERIAFYRAKSRQLQATPTAQPTEPSIDERRPV